MTTTWIVAFAALSVLTILLCVVVVGLLRNILPLLERIEADLSAVQVRDVGVTAAPAGARVAPFSAQDANGNLISSDAFAGASRLYLFVDFGCKPCERLMTELTDRRVRSLESSLVIIVGGDPSAGALTLPTSARVVFQKDRRVSTAFGSNATPHAFLVDEAGVIAQSTIPASFRDLRELAAQMKGGGTESRDRAVVMSEAQTETQ